MGTLANVANIARFFARHPLTRTASVAAYARFVSWQVRSRLQEEVIVDWIAGRRLAVRRGMTGATGNIYTGLAEFVDMMLVLHFLREEDLFLDIGANVGSYTVLASGVCGATTWAFEPDPDTASHLRRNIEINGLDSLVQVHEVALGPTDGEVAFTVGLDTINKVASVTDSNVRLVHQRALDELIGDRLPVMAKIDVEGYEEQVFRGADALVQRDCLKVLEVETVTSAIETLLAENGFERAYYDPFTRALSRERIGDPAANTIFVRDWTFVQSRLRSGTKISVLGHEI